MYGNADKSGTPTVYTYNSSKSRELLSPVTKLRLLTNNGSSLHIRVNVVPKITGNLQGAYFNPDKFIPLLKNISLADSVLSTEETIKIELFVAYDYQSDIFFCGDISMKAVSTGLNFMESKLRWISTSRLKSQDGKVDSSMSMLTYTSNPLTVQVSAQSDNQQPLSWRKAHLEELWNLWTLSIREPVPANDKDKALQKFRETIHLEDGRYQVTWPWKLESPSLSTNDEPAIGRLRSQVNRLLRNGEHLQKYDGGIQDQVQKGIVIANLDCKSILNHYIPLLTPVKTTTKLRMVFDASTKTRENNQSLNQSFHHSPVIFGDLCGLLLRFRLCKVALVADV